MLQHQKNLLSIHAGEDAVVKEAVLPTVWSCAIGQVTVFPSACFHSTTLSNTRARRTLLCGRGDLL